VKRPGPAVRFLALGGCLFALDAARSGPSEAPVPAAAALESDEELLLRRARELGFHETDSLVQRRLVRNMRFLAEDPARSDRELLRDALALGMDRSDLVVRRRLIQKLELKAEAAARTVEPSEAELAAFLAAHPERFADSERVRLRHVFLSRDRRGGRLEADARRLLSRLQRGEGERESASLGDPFLLGNAPAPRTRRELAREFGADFAEAVFAAPTGAWAGPVASSYGLHLVLVEERVAPRTPALAAVRGAVREALLAERGEARKQEQIAWLRSRE